MEATALAYTAGLLDGEGTLSISTIDAERAYFQMRAEVTMTDRAAIQWLQAHWPGHRNRPILRPGVRPAFRWSVAGDQAADLLRACLPYMVTKRTQAELILQFSGLRRANRWEPLTDVERARRRLLAAQFAAERAA